MWFRVVLVLALLYGCALYIRQPKVGDYASIQTRRLTSDLNCGELTNPTYVTNEDGTIRSHGTSFGYTSEADMRNRYVTCFAEVGRAVTFGDGVIEIHGPGTAVPVE